MKQLTAFEIEMRIEDLRRAEKDYAARKGFEFAAKECKKLIRTYQRRLETAKKREAVPTC